ncbi:MAG: hypothetical protein Q8N14_04690, partial [Candidatus Omnitrophota bacterium]|nr:hypothetical protein [Candidatus Omnitrophota bacterium]
MENQNFEEKNIKYISLSEASALSEISRDYLNVLIRRGKLKAIKIGKNWLTTRAWLEEYTSIKDKGNLVQEYISLFNAAKMVGVTSGYLNVAVRRGKLQAVKLGRNWVTTSEWLNAYQKSVGRTLEIIPKPKIEELSEIKKADLSAEALAKAEQTEFENLKAKLVLENEVVERLKRIESQVVSLRDISRREKNFQTFKDREISKKVSTSVASQEIQLFSRRLAPDEK